MGKAPAPDGLTTETMINEVPLASDKIRHHSSSNVLFPPEEDAKMPKPYTSNSHSEGVSYAVGRL